MNPTPELRGEDLQAPGEALISLQKMSLDFMIFQDLFPNRISRNGLWCCFAQIRYRESREK